MQAKSILSSSLGNLLEWYDFGLFAIYTSLFSKLFFPFSNQNTALISTLGVFAVGFFCRPLGALLFGYLGDKQGRVKTLRLSILMIALPTFLIGCLPTYEKIGILAPILLTFIRIWQGISIGGEYSGNLIYLAESAPMKYRATLVSLAGMGANLGILLATLVGTLTGYLFSSNVFSTWGWRIPFLISGLFSFFIFITRLKMEETPVFRYQKSMHLSMINPLVYMFRHNKVQLLQTLGLVCMGTTYYFFCFIYIPMYFYSRFQFTILQTSGFMILSFTAMIFLLPFSGLLCDWLGRRKLMLFNCFLIAILVVPGFYFLQQAYVIPSFFILILFTLASSLEQGTTPITIIENYPIPARYTGISLAYNFGNGLLGGTVPLISEWLTIKTNSDLAPAFYIAFCAILTWFVAYFIIPETKKRPSLCDLERGKKLLIPANFPLKDSLEPP